MDRPHRHPKPTALHVIMNPVAGAVRREPSDLAARCAAAGLAARVIPTTGPGDARRLARDAVAQGAGCVAVYGGDGTVASVAAALAGSDVPLAILPGGTANILAVNLGIPRRLDRAIALLAAGAHRLRPLDVGYAGDVPFLVRASVGYEAAAILESGQPLKYALGPFGYAVGAVRALNPFARRLRARFRLVLDGQSVEAAGLNVFIGNAPGLGRLGLVLGGDVQPDDGLLDVILVDATPGSLAGMAAHAVRLDAFGRSLPRWQARTVTIDADPPQPVHADGEALDPTPVTLRVDPGAVRVVVPG